MTCQSYVMTQKHAQDQQMISFFDMREFVSLFTSRDMKRTLFFYLLPLSEEHHPLEEYFLTKSSCSSHPYPLAYGRTCMRVLSCSGGTGTPQSKANTLLLNPIIPSHMNTLSGPLQAISCGYENKKIIFSTRKQYLSSMFQRYTFLLLAIAWSGRLPVALKK